MREYFQDRRGPVLHSGIGRPLLCKCLKTRENCQYKVKKYSFLETDKTITLIILYYII